MSVRKGGQVIAGTPNITTGHHVGEIFWTSRLDNELNGAVDANGAIYSVEAFTGEKSVPELLRKGSLPSVSMAEYESIVSTNGSCRAWGWDNGDTFRVPLLKDVYLMAGQAESAGEFISESLPNISGVGGIIDNTGMPLDGAFESAGLSNNFGLTAITGRTCTTQKFKASRSSSAYQDGAKVRPDSVRYRAMVQISTGATDEALMTCTGVLADVADLKQTTIRTDKITNCITEIPQDIKLELVDGTLTLKAGSKLYYPDGLDSNNNPKFNTRVTTSDYVANGQYGYDAIPHILCLNNADYWVTPSYAMVFSGATAPTGYQYMLWYDTANNVIKWTADSGSTWSIQDCSLPFGIATYNGGSYENGFKQIDQVFNGFGYIGSTVFALPGVKGLIPNGRNADGTLNNIEFETSKVLTATFSGDGNRVLAILSSAVGGNAYLKYDEVKNIVYNSNTGVIIQNCLWGNLYISSGKITSFTPKLPFRALDYSDKEKIVGWGMPDWNSRISIATNHTFTRKGYLLVWQHTISGQAALLNGQEILRSEGGHSYLGANYNSLFIPVDIGDTLTGAITGAIFMPCKGV